MGLSSYARSCYRNDEQQAQTTTSKIINSRRTIQISKDYFYFQQDKWFRFQQKLLFDPNKFIFLYANYQEQQQYLIWNWRKIDMKTADHDRTIFCDQALSPKWKYAIRKGVPIIHYRKILSIIFNKNFEIGDIMNQYKNLQKEIAIKQEDLDIHRFGIEGKMHEAAHCDFLNVQGIKALQRLLYILEKRKGKITYNKYIIHVAAIMLIFLSQGQAYYILSLMIDNSSNFSQQRLNSLRWHFTLTQSQLLKLAQSFNKMLKNKSLTIKKINTHFTQKNIQFVTIFRQIIENLFYGYLPFNVILKIFLLFLNEGVKIFVRVFYSILKITLTDILNCQNVTSVLNCIKKKCLLLNQQELRNMLKLAYTIRLDKYAFGSFCGDTSISLDSDDINQVKYYLPIISGESQILSFEDLQTIWGFLPMSLKNFDIQKKFPFQKQNLLSLIKSIDTGRCGLLIIQTTSEAIFGVYLSQWLRVTKDKQYFGSDDNFLFQLYPHHQKYTSSGENTRYCTCPEGKYLFIGDGGDGVSLQLNSDLLSGCSYKSNTYKNQPLHLDSNNKQGNNEFRIKKIEAFIIS